MRLTITIPRPHVPHGPAHVTADAADVSYLRKAVRNLDNLARGEPLWGSNLTATVRKLLLDTADAIENASAPGGDIVALISDLTDSEPCEFDHHGGCQAHGYLSLEPGEVCPQAEAKQWLALHPAATVEENEREAVLDRLASALDLVPAGRAVAS